MNSLIPILITLMLTTGSFTSASLLEPILLFLITFIGNFIGLVALPLKYIALIITIPILYCFLALFVKKLYIKKYGEWI